METLRTFVPLNRVAIACHEVRDAWQAVQQCPFRTKNTQDSFGLSGYVCSHPNAPKRDDGESMVCLNHLRQDYSSWQNQISEVSKGETEKEVSLSQTT